MYCIVYIYLIMLLFLAQYGYFVMYIPYDLEAVKDDLIWYTNQLEKYLEYHNDTSNQRHLSSHQMLQIWFPLEKKLFMYYNYINTLNGMAFISIFKVYYLHMYVPFSFIPPIVAQHMRCGFLRSTASTFCPTLK